MQKFEVLDDFQGCLLIVSHDRYFMDRLVDHLFVFEGNGVIKDFPGNYSQYRLWQKEKEQSGVNSPQSATSRNKSSENNLNIIGNKKQFSFKEKREFELLGREIDELTKEKEIITKKLNNGNTSFEELQQLSHRIAEVSRLLDKKEFRWLELSEVQ